MGLIKEKRSIRLTVVRDKYQVYWYDDRNRAFEAAQWCTDTYGPEWGHFRWRDIDRTGATKNYFTFHRMDHARWFMLKWATF